jgi:hypothetical protein
MVNSYSDLYLFIIEYMHLLQPLGKMGQYKIFKIHDVTVQCTGVTVPWWKCLVIDFIVQEIWRKWVTNTEIQILVISLLKPTGYMMHHQFNIQQLYALPTLSLCVLYLSENKQRLVPLTA